MTVTLRASAIVNDLHPLGATAPFGADASSVGDAEVVVVSVPASLNMDCHPDLGVVDQVVPTIGEHIQPNAPVIRESTTHPCGNEKVVASPIAESRLGSTDRHIACSLERIDPGKPTKGVQRTPRVGGPTPECPSAPRDLGAKESINTVAGEAKDGEVANLLETACRHDDVALANKMVGNPDELDIVICDPLNLAARDPVLSNFVPRAAASISGGSMIDSDAQISATSFIQQDLAVGRGAGAGAANYIGRSVPARAVGGAMTPRYGRVVEDLRALDTSAPVRASYEASKGSGFHAVLFGVRLPRPRIRSGSLQIGNLTPTTKRAADIALDGAKATRSDGSRVFGRRAPNGSTAPWSHDPDSGKNWPGAIPWWKIDLRKDQRIGDVKFVWEAARHRDLVVLARASRLEPEGPWTRILEDLLRRWWVQNRPERGVNWYASLELSLRVIAWSQVLTLAGEDLTSVTRDLMDEQPLASAQRLMVEVPYTLSSMKNNHLLGDALGLIVLARMFPAYRAAKRLGQLGERLFTTQLGRHVRPDGPMIEDSLSYHRFVLEMLIVRTLIGDAPEPVIVALRGASRHLMAMGVFEGEVPQYGDWDEGRVLASSGNALDVAGSAALGLALAGEVVPGELFVEHDELAWYAPYSARKSHAGVAPSVARPAAVSGGIAYTQRGPWRVWFKVGTGPSHGHDDPTWVWVQNDGAWLFANPGTGTYNGPLGVRNAFRTSSAHPVLRLDGHDQLGPHRTFLWMRSARGHLAPPVTVANTTVFLGWHNAYERLDPGARVGRAVLVTDRYVAVVEFVADRGNVRLQLSISLGEGVEFRNGQFTAGARGVGLFGCDEAQQAADELEPFRGWSSPTCGSWRRATC